MTSKKKKKPFAATFLPTLFFPLQFFSLYISPQYLLACVDKKIWCMTYLSNGRVVKRVEGSHLLLTSLPLSFNPSLTLPFFIDRMWGNHPLQSSPLTPLPSHFYDNGFIQTWLDSISSHGLVWLELMGVNIVIISMFLRSSHARHVCRCVCLRGLPVFSAHRKRDGCTDAWSGLIQRS